jgi:hypothetical protein
MSYLYSDCLVQGPIRVRSTGGGHSLCECSVCTLSGTSIEVIRGRSLLKRTVGRTVCLLLIDKVRDKEKTYICVSV